MSLFFSKRPTKQQVVIVIGSMTLLITLGYVLVAVGFIALGVRTSTSQSSSVLTALTGPTDVALEKTRLENEKLSAEIIKLRREVQPDLWTLFLANIPVIVGAIVGLVGIGRWMADRRDAVAKRLEDSRDAREKRLDDRFQSAIEGLGSEHAEARVQAVAILINFLQPGYERFYKEIFDLAVTNLGLQRPSDDGTLVEGAQTALFQVLVRLFRQSFVRAREETESGSGELDATYVYLAYARLTGSDLKNVYMPLAFLLGTNLEGAQLQGANLQGANLQGANLQGANLQGANLQGADLQGAGLYMAQLQDANLQGAKFQRANLQGAQLQGANLDGSQLQGAILEGAQLQGATLVWANLQGANLECANLEGANLESADLRWADLGFASVTQEQLGQSFT